MGGCPANFKGRLSGHSPYLFADVFDYTPGALVGQGPWLASADPSLTVEFPNFVQGPNDNANYGAKAPLVGAPAFNSAWFLEFTAQSFIASGDMNSTMALALRVGILQIAISLSINHATQAVTYNVWGGSISGTYGAYELDGQQVWRLEFDGTTARFYVGATLLGSSAESPGPDVPTEIVLQDKRNCDDFIGFAAVRFGGM